MKIEFLYWLLLLSITLDSVERLCIVLDRVFYDVRIDVVVKLFRFDSSPLSAFGQIIFWLDSWDQPLKNLGRFTPITCSPRKVSRIAPLNRYYIIIYEEFFGNYLFIVLVCKKNNNSFILVYFNYLFISCIQKK